MIECTAEQTSMRDRIDHLETRLIELQVLLNKYKKFYSNSHHDESKNFSLQLFPFVFIWQHYAESLPERVVEAILKRTNALCSAPLASSGASVAGPNAAGCLSTPSQSQPPSSLNQTQTPTLSSHVTVPLLPQRASSTKKDSRSSRNASFSRTPTIKSNATVTLYNPEHPASSVAEFRPTTMATTTTVFGSGTAFGGGVAAGAGAGGEGSGGRGGGGSGGVGEGEEQQQFQYGRGTQSQGSTRSISDEPSAAEGQGETGLGDVEVGRCRGAKRLTLDAPIEEWRSRSSSRNSRDLRAALSEEDAKEVCFLLLCLTKLLDNNY